MSSSEVLVEKALGRKATRLFRTVETSAPSPWSTSPGATDGNQDMISSHSFGDKKAGMITTMDQAAVGGGSTSAGAGAASGSAKPRSFAISSRRESSASL